jgi:hypothetical protein
VRPVRVDRHMSLYRILVWMTPPSHRSRFGPDQVTVFGDILRAGESVPLTWFRAVTDLVRVFGGHKAEVARLGARSALAVASLGPLVVGAMLSGVSIDEFDDVSWFVPLVALALLIQAASGVLWLTGRLDSPHRGTASAFPIVEAGALIAGAMLYTGTALGAHARLPGASLAMVGAVTAVHGLMGLLAQLTTGGPTSV